MRVTTARALSICVLLSTAASTLASGLYTFVGGNRLASVDPATGKVSIIGRTYVGTAPGLDFPPGDVTLYGIKNGWIKTFDITSGIGTKPVPMAPDAPSEYQSLAFHPTTGELYGADSVSDTLHKIDPSTGTVTAIGPLGVYVGTSGMDFAPDGTLYLLLAQGGAGQRHRLYTVDIKTGQAQLVGRIGFTFWLADLAIAADGTLYASGERHDDAPDGAGPYLFTIDPTPTSTGVLQTETIGMMAGLDDSGNVVYATATALGWGPTECVQIDIKPGQYPNPINLGSEGLVPVAVLSSETFDATLVNVDTVKLAGAGVAVRGKGNNLMAHEEDVNGDGVVDLVIQVETQNLVPEKLQTGIAILSGWTVHGMEFIGYDEIVIVPPAQ